MKSVYASIRHQEEKDRAYYSYLVKQVEEPLEVPQRIDSLKHWEYIGQPLEQNNKTSWKFVCYQDPNTEEWRPMDAIGLLTAAIPGVHFSVEDLLNMSELWELETISVEEALTLAL